MTSQSYSAFPVTINHLESGHLHTALTVSLCDNVKSPCIEPEIALMGMCMCIPTECMHECMNNLYVYTKVPEANHISHIPSV